jgi:hypothetical protein
VGDTGDGKKLMTTLLHDPPRRVNGKATPARSSNAVINAADAATWNALSQLRALYFIAAKSRCNLSRDDLLYCMGTVFNNCAETGITHVTPETIAQQIEAHPRHVERVAARIKKLGIVAVLKRGTRGKNGEQPKSSELRLQAREKLTHIRAGESKGSTSTGAGELDVDQPTSALESASAGAQTNQRRCTDEPAPAPPQELLEELSSKTRSENMDVVVDEDEDWEEPYEEPLLMKPEEWIEDVKGCSLAAQGLWLRFTFVMHNGEPYGFLQRHGKPLTDMQARRLTGGTDLEEYQFLMRELDEAGVIARTPAGTIYSRRLVGMDAQRRQEQARWARGHKTPDEVAKAGAV